MLPGVSFVLLLMGCLFRTGLCQTDNCELLSPVGYSESTAPSSMPLHVNIDFLVDNIRQTDDDIIAFHLDLM